MRQLIIAQLLASALLTACNVASAQGADPTDDLDCAVLTYHYYAHREILTNPRQREATEVVYAWYAAKMQKRAQDTGKTLGELTTSRASLLAAVERNPTAFSSTSTACAKRATEDPGFDVFAHNR